MSAGNYSNSGSSSRRDTTTGDFTVVSDMINLTRGMGNTRIGSSSSRSPRTGRRAGRSNNSSGYSGNRGTAKGLKPVAKKDMPYQGQTFVERPSPMIDQTDIGKKLVVEANFFKIRFDREVQVYQYDIQYKNSKDMEMRKAEFTNKAFWYAYRTTKGNPARPHWDNIFPDYHCIAYNGVNILWTTERLNFTQAELQIVFGCDDGKNYAMYIKYAGKVAVKPNPVGPTEYSDTIQIVDEVVTARVTCLYEDISHSFHKQGKAIFYVPQNDQNQNHVVSLGAGLEAWAGLHGAVKPNLQAGLLLNVDLRHSVFYRQKCNLVEFFTEVVTNAPFKGDLKQLEKEAMNGYQRNKLATILKGRSLEYRMPPRPNAPNVDPKRNIKIFKFSAVASKASNAHMFTNRETNYQMTIADYFMQQYGVRLRCPYLPSICINKAKNFWAPMEFIFTDTVIHKLKGKIPDRQLRTMVRDTAYPPRIRKEIILDMAALNVANDVRKPMYLAEQDEYMARYGIQVDRNMIKVNASLLPPPTLEFGQGESRKRITDSDHIGIWELQDGNTLKKITNQQLTIVPCLIFLTPTGVPDPVINLGPFKCLLEVLYHFGVVLPGGSDALVTDKFDCYKQNWGVMVDWMNNFKEIARRKCGESVIPLALFVFPYKCTTVRQNTSDYFSEYSMVKYICDVHTGVHCQGILSQTYASMAGNFLTNSTAHNVAIKILGKVGASLYKIDQNPEFNIWEKMTNPDEPVLLMGIDVTHPGEQDRREGKYAANSVACVVGNVDTACMQFEASVRAQTVDEERTLNIKDEVVKRLLAYEKNTGRKPVHVVVYRDGVSETQFKETLYEEKKAIQEAYKEISPDYKPTLTYIVISKRHHTRFFPTQKEDTCGKSFNLKPGTLVESDITNKNYFDFYLISQHGPLGTSRPCHYYVLHDEWAPSSTFWQQVTFALTYSYVRCPKSISQPAPVMYAHLAAKRAKDYLMAHVHMFGGNLEKMSEFESFTYLRQHMQAHKDLSGMIFV